MSEASQFSETLKHYEIVSRHIVMERHLNAHGNLFGGVVLAWLDEAAALYVMELAGYSNFVTISMDDVIFRSPGHRGDVLVIYCRTQKIGRSSITVQAQAWVHEPQSLDKHMIIECSLTFVCLKDGKPFPYFVSDEYLSWCHNKADRLPD